MPWCWELHREFPTADSSRTPPFFPCVLHDLGLGGLAGGFISNPCLFTRSTWDVTTWREPCSGLNLPHQQVWGTY
jgi:hypothetical protein